MSLEQFQAAIELGSILFCFLWGKSDLRELPTSKEALLSSKRLFNSVERNRAARYHGIPVIDIDAGTSVPRLGALELYRSTDSARLMSLRWAGAYVRRR